MTEWLFDPFRRTANTGCVNRADQSLDLGKDGKIYRRDSECTIGLVGDRE